MRSKILTLLLLLTTAAFGALAVIQLTQNDLSSVFGANASPDGNELLEFSSNEIHFLEIEHDGESRSYRETDGQWKIVSQTDPDRANYQALEALLACLSNLTILESFPTSGENLQQLGIEKPTARVSFSAEKNGPGNEVIIGRKAAWKHVIPSEDPRIPDQIQSAIYIRRSDEKFIYLCTSPFLDDVLANGFGDQRDLRPFFFPPEILAEITIRKPSGEITLTRPAPLSDWMISKPYQVETDPDAMKRLVGGLYSLTALEAANKPAPLPLQPDISLSLGFFSADGSIQEKKVTLLLKDDPTNESQLVARLDDDRADIEFLIPLKSTGGRPGVDDLPLSLEKLRGSSLTSLDLAQLRSMRITGTNLESELRIFIEKSPLTNQWRARRAYQGSESEANEATFFAVKKTLATAKALGVVSERSSELSNYGLEVPEKTFRLELFDGSSETLHLGRTLEEDGIPRFFLRRDGSQTVQEVTSETYFNLAARPYLWRDAEAWNFNIVDLKILQIERLGEEPLTLNYDDIRQSWTARLGQEDVTSLLNVNRANRYLETLEELTVDQWLSTDHVVSQQALESPVFSITAIFQETGEANAPLVTKRLSLAGTSARENRFYFGKVSETPNSFILDLAVVTKLATRLLESE